MTWPLVALVLGSLFIAALWDGLRRCAATHGTDARLQKQLDDRLHAHATHVDKLERALEQYASQTTQEIRAMQNMTGVRSMRA